MIGTLRSISLPQKVVLIGDAQVGNTSLFTRKLNGDF
jgi:hypothetical protein